MSIDKLHNALISYPFPLRPGLIARVLMPRDLTPDEARRVAAYVLTLVAPKQPEPEPEPEEPDAR